MEPVPEQDVRFGVPASAPTPWSDVRSVLEIAELFWVSTVRRDGRPHVTPLPAVRTDDCLHFCTGPADQKAVNLVGNPKCCSRPAATSGSTDSTSWSKGAPFGLTDEALLRALADLWRTKYQGDWDFAVEDGMFHHESGGSALVFKVAPTKVLAFAKGEFAQTRYRFAAPQQSSR